MNNYDSENDSYDSSDDSYAVSYEEEPEIHCKYCWAVLDDPEMADLERGRCFICYATKEEVQAAQDQAWEQEELRRKQALRNC